MKTINEELEGRQSLEGKVKDLLYPLYRRQKRVNTVWRELEALIANKTKVAEKNYAQMILDKYKKLPLNNAKDPDFLEAWLSTFVEFKLGLRRE